MPSFEAVKITDRVWWVGAIDWAVRDFHGYLTSRGTTYNAEDKVVFSQDGFGMHLASTERFDDELPAEVLRYEAAKYFANILLPLSKFVTFLLERLGGLDLDIAMIAPDHGPVWRSDVAGILERWKTWTEQKPTRKAIVVYDTMWGSTSLMARAIADGLAAGGASPKLMPLGPCHRSDVATEPLETGALLVGSPTLNNGLFPTVADCLAYLKGLKPQNLVGAAFGSYGWSGEAPKLIAAEIQAMGIELVADPLRVNYVPDQDALAACRDLGEKVAERLAALCA